MKKTLLLLVISFLCPSLVHAYTNNSVVPTIQPIAVSISFDSSDAAVCLASNPADGAFVIQTYNPNTNGYVYDGDLFSNLPFTLSTTSSLGNEYSWVSVYCTADGINPDYGAPNWFFNLDYSGNDYGNFIPYVVADASSSSTSTPSVSTTTVMVVDNPNMDMLGLLGLFVVCFLGFYWIFSKKR